MTWAKKFIILKLISAQNQAKINATKHTFTLIISLGYSESHIIFLYLLRSSV
jgi:hypothetical protein